MMSDMGGLVRKVRPIMRNREGATRRPQKRRALVVVVVMMLGVMMPRFVVVPAIMMRVRAVARAVRLASPATRLGKTHHERAAGRADAPEVGAQARLDAAAVRYGLLAEREDVVPPHACWPSASDCAKACVQQSPMKAAHISVKYRMLLLASVEL